MPNECRELLKNGSLTCITLWDPADAGYAMCELARKCLDGEEIGNGTDLGLSATTVWLLMRTTANCLWATDLFP